MLKAKNLTLQLNNRHFFIKYVFGRSTKNDRCKIRLLSYNRIETFIPGTELKQKQISVRAKFIIIIFNKINLINLNNYTRYYIRYIYLMYPT